MKKLIICEKNIAARRIASILSRGIYRSNYFGGTGVYRFHSGPDEFIVTGLRGHIIALDYPTQYNDWGKTDLQELVWIQPVKRVTAKNIVNTLGYLAKEVDEIIIATDYDREGELIGVEALQFITAVKPNINVKRARFSAITVEDLDYAFAHLDEVDYPLARSAESRQHVDLAWGAVLTRFLSLSSNQLGKDFLSVGRVQTPTLALIVDREREIENFVPTPYWTIGADLEKEAAFKATHEASPFWEKTAADAAFKNSKKAKTGKVLEVKESVEKDRGPVPFNTTMFLAESNRLGIGAFRAMKIAEKLYTEGYISYPRTDNCAYPSTLNLFAILKKLEKSELGPLVVELEKGKIRPRNGKSTKDHPPIHPVEGTTRSKLKGDEWAIYELVVRRFLATLAPDATVERTHVKLDLNKEPFISEGHRVINPGWRKYYPYYDSPDVILPKLSQGDEVGVSEVFMAEEKTKPPSRFSQGSLIQQMEKLGLGTKSTRHEIVQKLFERKYVHGRYIRPTIIGVAVAKALEDHARSITEPKMTAVLEEDMNSIADGNKSLEDVVKESQTMLGDVTKVLKESEEKIGAEISEAMRRHNYVGKCKKCGGDLIVLRSKHGRRFVGCSNYPNCTVTHSLPQHGSVIVADELCACGSPKITRKSGEWTESVCLDAECVTVKGKNIAGKCLSCGGDLLIRHSRHGKRFIGCSKFPNCKITFSLPQKGFVKTTGEVCKVCQMPLVAIITKNKKWNLCINKNAHPKKEKKAPKKEPKKKEILAPKKEAPKPS